MLVQMTYVCERNLQACQLSVRNDVVRLQGTTSFSNKVVTTTSLYGLSYKATGLFFLSFFFFPFYSPPIFTFFPS